MPWWVSSPHPHLRRPNRYWLHRAGTPKRSRSGSSTSPARSARVRALFQLERLVQHANRELEILFVDHDRDLDFRRRDHLDVDTLAGQRLEHLGREPDVRAHSDADDRKLRNPVVPDHLPRLEALLAALGV